MVLLQALSSVPKLKVKFSFFDCRGGALANFSLGPIRFVKRTFVSRGLAEWRLMRETETADTVLCFHGLPPLFRLRGRVVVFLQNRILVVGTSLSGYPVFTRARLAFERLMLRLCAANADEFIVQTASMARDVVTTLGSEVKVSICPFLQSDLVEATTPSEPKVFDFVYVASLDAHKNHRVLLEAWRLLAESGLRPSLALTLPKNCELALEIKEFAAQFGLHITNNGLLLPDQVMQLYRSSKALIFPSTLESFGLPLIEAARCGLPILAPEMDYVRDVANPVETFDPHSAVSVFRAVRRFLGCPEPIAVVVTPEDFLAKVLK